MAAEPRAAESPLGWLIRYEQARGWVSCGLTSARTAVERNRFVRAYRQSLQVRVVSTTVVCSAVIVLVVGVQLSERIVQGLVVSQREAALAEVAAGLRTLAADLPAALAPDAATPYEDLAPEDGTPGGAEPDDGGGVAAGGTGALTQSAGTIDRLTDLVRSLSARGSPAGRFAVLLRPLEPASVDYVISGEFDPASVPGSLSRFLDRSQLAYAYTELLVSGSPAGPGLVVGARVAAQTPPYRVFYLFPLSGQVETAAAVERVMMAGGCLLVILLAAVAVLVTRQVVTPVRAARRTAELLSQGLLRERMTVRGDDDLARLAESFNRMASALESKIDELERMSAAQRRFVSDVSHELRTPLTTVRMASDVLHASRAQFPPDLARSAELLQHEVERFEALLGDLLEISRHDAQVAVLDPDPVDVRGLVADAVSDVRPLAERQGCVLSMTLPDQPVVAEVECRRVSRILRNLLANAVEHGRGAKVTVELAADASALAVAVSDQGVGLRPGESSLVFNRFWRADPSRARATGGTGLGLAISLEDARLHGGWLQAWGEPRQGARFRLTLPLRAHDLLTESPLPLRELPHERAENAGESAIGAPGPSMGDTASGVSAVHGTGGRTATLVWREPIQQGKESADIEVSVTSGQDANWGVAP